MSISSILNNEIITVKCNNDSPNRENQKSEFGRQLQQSMQKQSYSNNETFIPKKDDSKEVSIYFKNKSDSISLVENSATAIGHIIDTYA